MTNKWVFNFKQESNQSLHQYKVRLVAKCFDQVDAVHFNETLSLVIKTIIIKPVLALAVQHDWFICQLDISNVFLHNYFEEKVYME